MARNGYSVTWRSMAFGWALAASSVSGRSWAYAASKRGGSRRPLSPGTGCRSRRTSWASSSRSTGPTQCGSQTSHMSPQMRAGCTWQATRTCLPESLFTGEIVGYAMGERLSRNLVSQSLLRALSSKRPSAGVLHHSDRGSQYCSQEYRSLLERFGLQTSMSRTGNCFDNAPMESFWGTLKQELVHHRHYGSRREAVRDITEYVESFYNRQRRQARLGFLSPAAYEKRYYAGLLAA